MRRAKVALVFAVKSRQEDVKKRKRSNFTVKYQSNEKVPEEYQDYVRRYFKALAEEE